MEEGDSSSSQSPAIYAPLRRAILEDDWNAAKHFIETHSNCLGAAITKDQDTALHFSVAAKRTRFVKNLVGLMTSEQLALKSNDGRTTALYFAAQSRIVTIAKVMVKHNKNLPSILPSHLKGYIQDLPLYAAIVTGNRDMVSYLYSKTPIQDLTSADRTELLKATISSNLYDTAHKILATELKLAPGNKDLLWEALEMLARKPSEKIGSKSQPSVWERCLNSCFRGRFCNKALMQASAHQLVCRLCEELGDDKCDFSPPDMLQHHKELVVEAARVGNIEFLIILIRSYPELIWQRDDENGTLFHVAIKYRQVRVFNLIYEIGVMKDNLGTYKNEGKNMMLRLARELPSQDRLNIVSGAALQMQRELLWFQEIEKIVSKSSVDKIEEIKTSKDIFVDTHKKLQKNGEKWMKVTASSCMLVATLIATVVFPSAFTIPGGNNQEGIPIFLESNWFTVFFISDAVAMLFSSASILVFLSILASRYMTNDFLILLPCWLALGLATLLISIVGMLIAFTAACFLVFKSKTSSVPISILVAAPAVPISLFVILQHGLWVDIFYSAFCSNWFLFRSQNRLFKQARWLACWGKIYNQS
ncbi:ankyrin repeat-containing protein NPR4-like isoform X1 [Juglans regia]|uniref:Ankyrin repeat-containing protein NPR4-like isoform X1 n=2 Tax=Juglans regia TaxID=51240 RepID=A0A6P9EJ49_JUGRE|nr:ankyrin repeat-containing protein NPR4-like isoform X1 [Juglans regia]XP_035547524.1 ankyrin repeat-containing protein NPR4-like isoform X1 [Juglans regia]